GRHVDEDDAAGADFGVPADLDIAEHLGAGREEDAVAHLGVAVAALLAGATERHLLEDLDVVADHRRLADDDAGAVVDEDAGADRHGGMDVDGENLGDAALQKRRDVAPAAA